MQTPSIQEMASRARDVAKYQNIPIRDAIHSVAEEYGVDCAPIARELSRRANSIKEKNKRKKEVEKENELARLHNEKRFADAVAHEQAMRRSFILTGHLDDY